MWRPKINLLAVAGFLTFYAAGVNSGFADASGSPAGAQKTQTTKRIVVLPFQNMVRIHGENSTVRGPVTRKVFITKKVAPEAELLMDKDLRQELLGINGGIQWQLPDTIDTLSLAAGTNGPALVKRLQQIGHAEKADAVLVGYLYGFREREGGDYGAEVSASISFELALVRVQDGAVIWRKGFTETQRALSENLREIGKFFKRKGRWVTARQMGRQAMREMLESLPWLREQTAQ